MTCKITRVDAVMTTDSTPKPIFFFDPDHIILDYLMINNPTMIKISGTEIYDGEYLGLIDKANLAKGMYGVTIDTIWKGYPDPGLKDPQFEILGIESKKMEGVKKPKMKSEKSEKEEKNEDKSDKALLVLGLVIIGLSIFVMSNK